MQEQGGGVVAEQSGGADGHGIGHLAALAGDAVGLPADAERSGGVDAESVEPGEDGGCNGGHGFVSDGRQHDVDNVAGDLYNTVPRSAVNFSRPEPLTESEGNAPSSKDARGVAFLTGDERQRRIDEARAIVAGRRSDYCRVWDDLADNRDKRALLMLARVSQPLADHYATMAWRDLSAEVRQSVVYALAKFRRWAALLLDGEVLPGENRAGGVAA